MSAIGIAGRGSPGSYRPARIAGRGALLALFLAGFLAVGARCDAAADGPVLDITVDPRSIAQEIEHFGASAAWWAQYIGAWPEGARERILDLLFDPVKGIGLDLVRYNIGGGKAEARIADPWRSAESPLRADGGLDWSRDAAAMAIVDGAVKRGARVLLFFNSPPAPMTVTGSPTGNGRSSNLRADSREPFARFLARCARELGSRWPIAAISPMNEPQWDWQPAKGQEGARYSPREARDLLSTVARVFREEGIDLSLSAIDSGDWKLEHNKAYVEAILSDPGLKTALTGYALHSYWSKDSDRVAFAAWIAKKWPGSRLWMTEWTEMRPGKDLGMRAALALAETVHEDLCLGGASSWQYWIAVSKYDYADGLIYANELERSFEASKKLWALGNWSKFVEPGAVRLSCEADRAAGLRVSAFRNPDRSLVVVAINSGERASPPLRVVIAGKPVPSEEIELWETSAELDLRPRELSPDGTIKLPIRSVTTIVVSGTY